MILPHGNVFMGFIPSLNIVNGNSQPRDRDTCPDKGSALSTPLIPIASGDSRFQIVEGGQCTCPIRRSYLISS